MLEMAYTDKKDSAKKNFWVVEVEKLLDGQNRPVETRDGLIHKVPESLLRKETKVFYYPQVISLGPFHFNITKNLDDEMELLKTEAARKVHNKIKCGGVESGLKSKIECLKEQEQKVKKSYAKNFEVTGEECAWMIARDACFVLQVLETFREVEVEDAEKSLLASILSRKRHHPLMTEIVKDMLKMENQLPFWALQEIQPDIEDWFDEALKNISPIEVANVKKNSIVSRPHEKQSHLLQLLHDSIVGRPPPPRPAKSSDRVRTPPTSSLGDDCSCTDICEDCPTCHHICAGALCQLLCGYAVGFAFLCFRCDTDYLEVACCPCIVLWNCIKELFRRLVHGIILVMLSPVVLIVFIINVIPDNVSPKWDRWEHVPTVEDLKRLGVKFKKLEGEESTIRHIKFKERNRTLYLPQFKVNNRSEVMLRNLIALEICSEKEEKPITRYVTLMNDLINTSGDVGMLRREDIITSELGSDEDIAQFWNSMTSTEVPRFESIDKAVSSIHDYRKKWWSVLWAQFLMTHCSKPWLFLSLLAGLLLLMFTIVQVVCLFESCQIK